MIVREYAENVITATNPYSRGKPYYTINPSYPGDPILFLETLLTQIRVIRVTRRSTVIGVATSASHPNNFGMLKMQSFLSSREYNPYKFLLSQINSY